MNGPIFATEKRTVTFMYRQKYIIPAILLIVFLSGCRKSYVLNEKQHVLFQYDYINFAWGYIHEGFYIDDKGKILEYYNPEGWNFHKGDFNLTETQLAENLSKCTVSERSIDKAELAKFSSYIHNLASSKVTAPKNEANDAGSAIYLCYTYNEQGGIYKGTMIRMEGDSSCENLNFFSRKVSMWMKEINSGLHKK